MNYFNNLNYIYQILISILIFYIIFTILPFFLNDNRKKVAIVGGGVAGLSAGYMLSKKYHCTIFEASDRLGGVARTINGIDTGIIYMKSTHMYPYLTRFLKHFNIKTKPLPITLAVANLQGYKDWVSNDMNHWNHDIYEEFIKFDQLMKSNKSNTDISIKSFCEIHGFSSYFKNYIITSLLGMILHTNTLSTHMFKTLYPSLPIFDIPNWKLPINGTQSYINKFAKSIQQIYLNSPVKTIKRNEKKIVINTPDQQEEFDYLILATPMKINNKILNDKTKDEQDLFNKYSYNEVTVVTHTDENLITNTLTNTNSYSYIYCDQDTNINTISPNFKSTNLKPKPPYVSVSSFNNMPIINKYIIDKKIYLHPDFDTIDKHGGYEYRMHILNKIQGKNNTFYCGQDTVNEFWHELVLQSGLYVANMLGVPPPFKSEGYSLFLPFHNIIGSDFQ